MVMIASPVVSWRASTAVCPHDTAAASGSHPGFGTRRANSRGLEDHRRSWRRIPRETGRGQSGRRCGRGSWVDFAEPRGTRPGLSTTARLTLSSLPEGYEVVGTYKEIASGVKLDRAERRKVLALAQRREIDAVLVTELSRWGRSTTDLLATLKELEARRVSLVALNGMTFDLTTPHGRMMATLLAGIAEFERELTVERIRSGIAAAKARGAQLGRRAGQRPKSDRLAPKVLALVAQGRSYRLVGREVGLSKNTVAEIVKRNRTP